VFVIFSFTQNGRAESAPGKCQLVNRLTGVFSDNAGTDLLDNRSLATLLEISKGLIYETLVLGQPLTVRGVVGGARYVSQTA